MPRLSVLVLSAVLGAGLALPAAAQWKWRDGTGHIQYSDLPPPQGVNEQDILQRPSTVQQRRAAAAASAPASTASAPALKPKTVEPELEAKRKKAEQEAAEKAKAEEARLNAARADNCGRAKSYLRTLDDGIRVARNNPTTGEREILDDKARAEESRRAREVVSSDCK